MFGEHRSDVRVVMLDGERGNRALMREVERKLCRVKAAVEIVRDQRRLDLKEFEQAADRRVEEIAAAGLVEVAEVL